MSEQAGATEIDYTEIRDDEVRSAVCRIMSEMLDNPDEYGIYPTSRFMWKPKRKKRMSKTIKKLRRMNACKEAIQWIESKKSLKEAWNTCERGDWMLWLLGKKAGKVGSASRKKLVLCVCACARLSLKYIPKGEKRPLIAIETAESYARGEHNDLSKVANAANATNSAKAAVYAVYAANVYSANVTASAVANAVANVADTADARRKALKKCADIVREHYKQPRI